MTDGQLMDGVVRRDSKAVSLFVARFEKSILKYILGSVRNKEDAVDITQEVLFRICDKADLYDRSVPLAAWVFRVARNLAIDYQRRKNFRVHSGGLPFEESVSVFKGRGGCFPDEEVMKKEIVEQVHRAMLELPTRQREVVQLRLLADLRLEEIAQATGLSLGGVKSTLFAALKNLRKQLARLEREVHVKM